MKWLMPEDEIIIIEAILAREVSAEELSSKEIVAAQAPLSILPGGTAVIKIDGVLLNERNEILDFFGRKHTAYKDIIQQTADAQNRGAKRIRYEISSPGGQVEGIYGAMDAIRNSSIPTKTVAINKLTSGAYMLAAQTGHIEAMDELTSVGSIGVAVDYMSFPFIKRFSNTDSPKKRPALDNDEGAAMVREELDDFYQVLAERTAEGRGVSVDEIKNKYGQGAVVTARTALANGMIDSIRKSKRPASRPAEAKETSLMDKSQLKAEHSAVYQEVLAEGVEAGVQKERERVTAHLVAAEGGDVQAAHDAIRNGEGYNDLVKAKHDAYARKVALAQSRKDDNPPPVATVGQASSTDEAAAKAEYEAAHPGMEVS